MPDHTSAPAHPASTPAPASESRPGPARLLSRGRTPKPLSPEEFNRLTAAGERLAAELAVLLDAVPRSAASALSLSRDLKIDRNLCHRVCAALEERETPLDMLMRFPGPEALSMFVEAAAKRSRMPEHKRSAAAAVEQFRRLILELAGSHSRLLNRLKLTRQARALSAERGVLLTHITEAQQALFDNARSIMGAWCEALTAIHVMSPSTTPHRMNYVASGGYRGLHAEAAAFPITPTMASRIIEADGVDRDTSIVQRDEPTDSTAPPGFLASLSTSPTPPMQLRSVPGGSAYIIEPGIGGQEGVNLYFRSRSDGLDPRRPGSDLLQIFLRHIRTPTRLLVLDVLIHRELSVANISVAAVHTNLSSKPDPVHGWVDRLPADLQLQTYCPGTDPVAIAALPDQEALVRNAIENTAHSPDEFVGHRCVAPYPFWGASYIMNIRFNPV